MKAFMLLLFFCSFAMAQDIYQVSISSSGGTEVSEKTGLVSFQVELDRPLQSGALVVNFATKGHNARPGLDFVPVAKVLTFTQGEVLKHVDVPLIDDKSDEESEELFHGEITSISPNALIIKPFEIISIIDDEEVFEVQNIKAQEPDSGESSAQVAISREFPSKERVILQISSEDETASAGADYVPYLDQLVFEPGELSKTVEVKIIGDKKPELEESFTLKVEGISGEIQLTNPLPTVSILDDDGVYAIRFSGSLEMSGQGATMIQTYDTGAIRLNLFKDGNEEYFYSDEVSPASRYYVVDYGSFEVRRGNFSVKKLSAVSDGQVDIERIKLHYVLGPKLTRCKMFGQRWMDCPYEKIHGIIHKDELHPNDQNLPGLNIVTTEFKKAQGMSDGAVVLGRKTFKGVFPLPDPHVDDAEETLTIEILKIEDES